MENQSQNSNPEKQTISIQVPSADNIAGRRPLIPISFALVIIFFFFNFFVIKCSNQKVGSVTGINLVTGTELKSHDMFSGQEVSGEKIPSNIWAIIALSSAIIGFGAFIIKGEREAQIGAIAGGIGFSSLLILQFAIKTLIEKKSEGAPIEIESQIPYWGAIFAFGIGGIISYFRAQRMVNVVAGTIGQAYINKNDTDVKADKEKITESPITESVRT